MIYPVLSSDVGRCVERCSAAKVEDSETYNYGTVLPNLMLLKSEGTDFIFQWTEIL